MRVFVLDTGLKSGMGHHSHFATHFPRSVARFGLELRYFAARDTMDDSLAGQGVQPLFRQFLYRRYSQGDKYLRDYEDVVTGAGVFAEDLRGLGDAAPRDDDLVFLHTAGLREVFGLALWMKATGRKPRTAMLFHFAFPWDRWVTDLRDGTVRGMLYRMTGHAIAAMMDPDRRLIAATNKGLADLIALPLGHRVNVLPPPIWYEWQASQGKEVNAQSIQHPVISFLGQSRPDKGLRIIPSIIRKIHERNPEAEFVAHLNAGMNVKAADFEPYETLEKEGYVRLIRGFIPEAELNALIHASSLVLMPFDRGLYRMTLSGTFALVTALGRPSIVPAGTWMDDQIKLGRAAGMTFAGNGVDAIADSVSAALEQRELLVRRAEELASSWRQQRSGDALVDRLMHWAGVQQQT